MGKNLETARRGAKDEPHWKRVALEMHDQARRRGWNIGPPGLLRYAEYVTFLEKILNAPEAVDTGNVEIVPTYCLESFTSPGSLCVRHDDPIEKIIAFLKG